MTGFIKRLILILVAIVTASIAQAANKVVQFSAEAVQTMPARPPMSAKIFVGKNAVRSEYMVNGNQVIEIVHAGNKGRVVLMPAKKQYMEQRAGYFQMPGTGNKVDSNPCKGVVNVSCKKIGSEILNGRKAVKWEFINKQRQGELRSLHWFDAEHNFPIRQQYPDGTLMEMRFVRKENINGRDTELWDWSGQKPNGRSMHSRQWLDPKLNIAIREERPGGYVRELRNIKLGNHKNSLFSIPKGYARINNAASWVGAGGGGPRP